jgi:hypothetical protein
MWPQTEWRPDAPLREEDVPTAGDLTGWRKRRLLGAGFDQAQAASLAGDSEVDLHALIELVERGCPPELAARIMAPLDRESDSC